MCLYVRASWGGGRGIRTLHLEVLVAFTPAEAELFGIVAHKDDPVRGVDGMRTHETIVDPIGDPSSSSSAFCRAFIVLVQIHHSPHGAGFFPFLMVSLIRSSRYDILCEYRNR